MKMNTPWKGTPFDSSYRNSMFRILIPTFFAGFASLGLLFVNFSRIISDIYQSKLFLSVEAAAGMAGILTGVDILAKLGISPLTGYLSDKFGRRKLIVTGMSLGIIASLTFLWAYLFDFEIAIVSFLWAGTIFLGLEKGQTNTSITIASGDTGEEYNQIGRSEAAWDVALIAGMISGVAIATLLDLNYYQQIFLSIFIFIAAAIFSFFLTKETLQPLGPNIEVKKTKINDYKDILKEKNFIPLFIFAFAVEAQESGMVFYLLPLMFEQTTTLSSNTVTIIVFLPAMLSLAIFFIPAGILSDKYGRKRMALFGMGISIILMVLLSFTGAFPIEIQIPIIVSILITLGFFVCLYRMPLMSSLTDLTNRQSRGIAYGILRGFREFGGAVAPFILGAFLILGFNFYNVILIMALITGICFALNVFLFRETVRMMAN
ncbi:MAG: MFS transporter [Candidatus Lokiarchaeota archaeon]|nr:MFS transporter [Candidatus Lokiarchaeota archaeon]